MMAARLFVAIIAVVWGCCASVSALVSDGGAVALLTTLVALAVAALAVPD